MSRVGKYPVEIPSGVEVTIAGHALTAKGKLGEQAVPLNDDIAVERKDNMIWVTPRNESKRARALWGTTRNLVSNAVQGVSQGYTRRLMMTGVGYRAQLQGQTLTLQLGYSHDILYEVPTGVTVELEGDRRDVIAVKGPSKQKVGQVASEIRAYRPPEPYKGKGVRYDDEVLVRKEGKKK